MYIHARQLIYNEFKTHPFREELIQSGVFNNNIKSQALKDVREGAHPTFLYLYDIAFKYYGETEAEKEEVGNAAWGLCKMFGDGDLRMDVKANESLSQYWLGIACLYGNPEAMNYFVSFALDHIPEQIDYTREFTMRQIAFDKGDEFAGIHLAQAYAFSPHIEINDPQKAVSVLNKVLKMDADKHAKSKASAIFGYMYETGLNVSIDFPVALTEYEKGTLNEEVNNSYSLFFYAAFLLLGAGAAGYDKKRAESFLAQAKTIDIRLTATKHDFHTNMDQNTIKEGLQKLREWQAQGKSNEILRFELAVLRMALRYEMGAFGIKAANKDTAIAYYKLIDYANYEFVRKKLMQLRSKRISQQFEELSIEQKNASKNVENLQQQNFYLWKRQNNTDEKLGLNDLIKNDKFSYDEHVKYFHRALLCQSYYRIFGKALVGGDELQRNENTALDKAAKGTNLLGKLASSFFPGTDMLAEIVSSGLTYAANMAAVEAGQQLAQNVGLGSDIERFVRAVANEVTNYCNGHEPVLMSELVKDRTPQPNKLYLTNLKDGNIGYIALSDDGEKIHAYINKADLNLNGFTYCTPNLADPHLQAQILTIVTNRGHARESLLRNPQMKKIQKLYAGLTASDYVVTTLSQAVNETGQKPDAKQVAASIFEKIQKEQLLMLSKDRSTTKNIKNGTGTKAKGVKRGIAKFVRRARMV